MIELMKKAVTFLLFILFGAAVTFPQTPPGAYSSPSSGSSNGQPVTPTSVNVTNPGVFNTTTTVSTYSAPNIFGTGTPPSGTMAQCAANIQNGFTATGFTDTDAFDACIFVPSSGVTNGASTAIQGLAYNNNANATGQFGFVGAIGLGGLAYCNAGSAANLPRCYGISLGATSLAGNGGNFLAGAEADIQANNNTDQGFGFLASMRGTGAATSDNMKAFWAQQNGGATNQWTTGFECGNASVALANGAVCLQAGKQLNSGTSPSQGVNFSANNGSVDIATGWQLLGQTPQVLSLCCTTAVRANSFWTSTNCLVAGSNAASSAVACGSAGAGMFSIPITTPTSAVVTTTALTANSEIFVNQRLDTTNGAGAALAVTCNTTPNTTAPLVTARTATSFTITFAAFGTNPGCYQYNIVN